MIPIEYFEILPSTQTYLIDKIKKSQLNSPICIVAKIQTKGIGSRGNQWEQVENGLTFSFSFKDSSLPIDLPVQSISIFFGFIFKEILVSMGFDIWLKWPNDLYIGGSKIGGVMVNIVKNHIVCGIGVNIYGKRFASLMVDIPKEKVLRDFFEKIRNTSSWKEIFSKYALEFHKNFKFSFHYENETLDLKGANLMSDGGIELNGKKIYSYR
ncbi:biotin--[acetyl-CoA-carboxylase] ligase [Helicobacter sp. 13S00477-4]|uniref:biotin--[acetyl-CoA-carboxylase] ligase n=1 Tax=Helicobacter sp. 13S00477-4 TaxID=1905759 RepID=UPI000BA7AE71|nr:biotin--[acetyl-CoA-carboxylase] ligase [Helicobacter sp. 13S00477-4]PAF52738.1 biotin--[acetyl-CoA-carboxylase] ligase [Helicobacter sp. 13S00477-4]